MVCERGDSCDLMSNVFLRKGRCRCSCRVCRTKLCRLFILLAETDTLRRCRQGVPGGCRVPRRSIYVVAFRPLSVAIRLPAVLATGANGQQISGSRAAQEVDIGRCEVSRLFVSRCVFLRQQSAPQLIAGIAGQVVDGIDAV